MIITISREFGSGGRELGKRLADALEIPCYDHQIIDMVAEKSNMSKDYVAWMSEKDVRSFYPATIGRSFISMNSAAHQSMQITAAEHEIIKRVAKEGPCVIVGRAADAVLSDMAPFNIFVCASEESKLARCRERAKSGESLSDKEILKKCKEIDRERRAYHEAYSLKKWGDAASYDLCINTSGKEIKALIPAIAAYLKAWFAQGEAENKQA